MELTILGSGTAALQAERGPSGHLLKIGSSVCLLDSGSGTLLKCLQTGTSYKEIDRLFYTHMHPDHTIDLIPFLFATKYTPGFQRRKKLTIYGPAGFADFYERLLSVYGRDMVDVGYEIEVRELASERICFDRWHVQTAQMRHSRTAIGYRFECAGRSFVYSGDTGFCDEIVGLAHEADLLLLECSFADDNKVEGHLTPTEAGEIARLAAARRLLLTHIYPPFGPDEIITAVRSRFHGEVAIAHDLQRVLI